MVFYEKRFYVKIIKCIQRENNYVSEVPEKASGV